MSRAKSDRPVKPTQAIHRHGWAMRAIACSIAAMMLLATGCAGLPISELQQTSGLENETTVKKKKAPRKHGNPNQIVMTANPCWLQDSDKPTHTGLFCRMYFFDGNDPIPLSVNGDIEVIAYDAAKEGTPEKPQGSYKLSNDELGRHYRPDIVGDSYVFWFHYQTAEVADLQIQATLKLKNGKQVTSGWVKIQLDPNAISAEDAMAQLSTKKAGATRPSLTYVPQGSGADGKGKAKASPIEQIDDAEVTPVGARVASPPKPARKDGPTKSLPTAPSTAPTNQRSSGEL